jgi:hypothetical protein
MLSVSMSATNHSFSIGLLYHIFINTIYCAIDPCAHYVIVVRVVDPFGYKTRHGNLIDRVD